MHMPQAVNKNDSELSSLPELILGYLLRNGATVSEIAECGGVTRASVHNWLRGSSPRDTALIRIIKFYNLSEAAFELICPKASLLTERFFDPASLSFVSQIEALKDRYISLVKSVVVINDAKRNVLDYGDVFKSSLLDKYGKIIFDAAYIQQLRGGRLALVCTSSNEFDRAEVMLESWTDDCEYVFEANVCVSRLLGLESASEYKVQLSEVVENFPNYLIQARKVFGNSVSLRVCISPDVLVENELELFEFEWETASRNDNPLDFLFTWISDVDGRRACDKVFSSIKSAIKNNEKSLMLIIHDGCFRNETNLDDEELEFDDLEVDNEDLGDNDKIESRLLTQALVLNKMMPVNERLRGFLYSGECDYESEKDRLRVFVCPDGSVATEVFCVPSEIPKDAFLFLFPALGYKINLHCDRFGASVHSALISW
jgi:transcriptional regulator with XRE-family HTH domain